MSQQYVRKVTEGQTPQGWKVVTIPGEGTFEVETALATEIEWLLSRGKNREARALLFWFDVTTVEES
jgi:hypothetical protein